MAGPQRSSRVPMDLVDSLMVTVTFLRMGRPPADIGPALPEGAMVQLSRSCTVAQYRYLYDTVGADYMWWLRRALPDAQMERLLRDPAVTIHVLTRGDRIDGFYELDAGNWPVINLSYFGLMPHMIGAGIGYAFLRHAVDTAWRRGPTAMTVNTCTADHPRAMSTYVRAGFRQTRQVREQWDIPVRLGLRVPDALNPVRTPR